MDSLDMTNQVDVLQNINTRNPSVPKLQGGIFPRFFRRVEQAGMKENGQPDFQDREYVELIMPGDKNNTCVYAIYKPWGQAFLRERGLLDHYQKWKSSNEAASHLVDGMPLDQWAGISREMAETLKFNKVYTVEQLAAAHDGALAKIGPGAFELRKAAQAWTSDAVNRGSKATLGVEIDELNRQLSEQGRRENEKDAEIAKLHKQLADLAARVGGSEAAPDAVDAGGAGAATLPESPPEPPPMPNREGSQEAAAQG